MYHYAKITKFGTEFKHVSLDLAVMFFFILLILLNIDSGPNSVVSHWVLEHCLIMVWRQICV